MNFLLQLTTSHQNKKISLISEPLIIRSLKQKYSFSVLLVLKRESFTSVEKWKDNWDLAMCFFQEWKFSEYFVLYEKFFFSKHKRRRKCFCGFYSCYIFIAKFLVKKFFMFFFLLWKEKLLDNEWVYVHYSKIRVIGGNRMVSLMIHTNNCTHFSWNFSH